jgi:hypothetical protein
MSTVVTPAQIEKRLYDLSKEIDEAQKYCEAVEKNYYDTKSAYEVGLAKSRMKFASVSSPTGKNYTVQEREDLALIENEDLHFAMGAAEATVRSVRANITRIKTQVDIARSIGTSVRVAMEL